MVPCDSFTYEYDFGGKYAQSYESTCECGRKIIISSYNDEVIEYYHDVFVKCICGKSIYFKLPI